MCNKIADDLANMTVTMAANVIVVDIRRCSNMATYKIVLLNIIRLQANSRNNKNAKARPVEVRISENDTRRFRIAEHIDGLALQSIVLSDRILQRFSGAG